MRAGTNQPVHWFLGGKGLGIQQGTSVWVGSPMQALNSRRSPPETEVFLYFFSLVHPNMVGWGKPTRTLVLWRQGFRLPTRNECMNWFVQIWPAGANQPIHSLLGGKGLGIQQGTSVWVGSPKYGRLGRTNG